MHFTNNSLIYNKRLRDYEDRASVAISKLFEAQRAVADEDYPSALEAMEQVAKEWQGVQTANSKRDADTLRPLYITLAGAWAKLQAAEMAKGDRMVAVQETLVARQTGASVMLEFHETFETILAHYLFHDERALRDYCTKNGRAELIGRWKEYDQAGLQHSTAMEAAPATPERIPSTQETIPATPEMIPATQETIPAMQNGSADEVPVTPAWQDSASPQPPAAPERRVTSRPKKRGLPISFLLQKSDPEHARESDDIDENITPLSSGRYAAEYEDLISSKRAKLGQSTGADRWDFSHGIPVNYPGNAYWMRN
ncbi:hypothetical protein SCP_1400680 [Sparassis crispa]|uniref:Uncharacterized protein n=1 Tax=Sparassis crispa TaxID=139825 RepID=A0A401H2P6_9APHY|nr:hypothetical protein SCP_1400680 [Sparassis crispa]GBE88663.1 hypothetical protein SCP_1400680 [Sparassis crispa]